MGRDFHTSYTALCAPAQMKNGVESRQWTSRASRASPASRTSGLQNAYRTSQPVSNIVHRIEVVRGHRWMPWPLSVDMSVDDALHLRQSPCTTYLYSRARQLARQSFVLAQLCRFANPWHAACSDHTALHGLRRISSIGGSHTSISFQTAPGHFSSSLSSTSLASLIAQARSFLHVRPGHERQSA